MERSIEERLMDHEELTTLYSNLPKAATFSEFSPVKSVEKIIISYDERIYTEILQQYFFIDVNFFLALFHLNLKHKVFVEFSHCFYIFVAFVNEIFSTCAVISFFPG